VRSALQARETGTGGSTDKAAETDAASIGAEKSMATGPRGAWSVRTRPVNVAVVSGGGFVACGRAALSPGAATPTVTSPSAAQSPIAIPVRATTVLRRPTAA
jgi:hypothetical protein